MVTSLPSERSASHDKRVERSRRLRGVASGEGGHSLTGEAGRRRPARLGGTRGYGVVFSSKMLGSLREHAAGRAKG